MKAVRPGCHGRWADRYLGVVVMIVILTVLAGGQSLWSAEPGANLSHPPAGSSQLNWVPPRTLPSRGTTQHNLSMAQPVDSRTPRAGNVTVLRWRTPDAAQAQLAASSGPQPTRIVTVSTGGRDRYPVRQVSATDLDLPAAIPDAFDDPFEDGDRRPATPVTAPAQLNVEPDSKLIAQQQPALPALADTIWQDDPPPKPDFEGPPEDAPQQLPPPTDRDEEFQQREKDQEQPCDRVYNRRDCCDEVGRCVDARETWERDAISKISLDITPSMHPRILDPSLQEEERSRSLAQSPVRSWHDRQGNLVAEGRLSNIKRGRVLIIDANNQIAGIPFNDLSDDDLCFLTAWWNVPEECTLGDEPYKGRNWAPSTLTWKASALCHKPLYFEEVQLERYGHTAGPIKQPLLSGAHFFASLITVPYQAGINPPWECRYPLGYYRPGSCAPWLVPPVPLSVRGGLWEAGAFVGGVAIFP